MMPTIQILPDRVANQIAAGEVIERPVAVIKELVENSLDAGATRVEIEFRNGGKSYMRVEDNGRGMTPDEALLCLERHATSKIRSADDLQRICSFGFRGEALPSIASVARFTLRTRHESFNHGTDVTISGGKLLDKKECGMPVGTMIEVSQLFNSVPARRKFLKTDATETAHITYNCRLFAIANPGVSFRLIDNGREVFQSPSSPDLRDRIGEIWGWTLAKDLIPVDYTDENLGLRLSGLTAKPGVARSTRRELITLVNRRPVDSRTMGFAVLDAYLGRLPKGRYPPAFLFLEISPQAVDVNVHPAKREVRFRNEGEIRRFVLAALTETLNASRQAGLADENASAADLNKQNLPPQLKAATVPSPNVRTSDSQVTALNVEESAPKEAKASKRPTSSKSAPAELEAQKRISTGWKLLARLSERYALMETPQGLTILHLRHADQRIRYEHIVRTHDNAAPVSQGLLIAEPLEFEPLAAQVLETHLPLLNANGFLIEPFGRNFFRIESVPSWLFPEQSESFLRDLIEELRQRGAVSHDQRVVWERIAALAAKDSYQRSDPITDESIQAMVENLLDCEVPHSSPFGKPTYQEISWSELERRFKGQSR